MKNTAYKSIYTALDVGHLNRATDVKTAEKALEGLRKAIEDAFEWKKESLQSRDKDKAKLLAALKSAASVFEGIEEANRADILGDDDIVAILDKFGLKGKKAKSKTGRTRTFTPEQRAKISAGQKARWAKRNAEKQAAAQPTAQAA